MNFEETPLQIVSSSRGSDDLLAQFILYDGCTAIGARIPIWGSWPRTCAASAWPK